MGDCWPGLCPRRDKSLPYLRRRPYNVSKPQLGSLCARIAELCCQFCTSGGTVNDPFCWLQTQHLILCSAMFGDSDYRTWSKLGDLSSSVYALGLHQSDKDTEESICIPFFLREIRKRVMACAYAMDKQLATSLGRPPRICSRYCHLALPLDIPYDRMCSSDNADQLMRHIDENGWNTETRLTVSVRIRVMLLTSLLQESVLELSLCPGTEDISERVADLIQQSHQTQSTLPPFLRWLPAHRSRSAADESRLFAHVEFTYQEFLLHRILLKRLGTMTPGLIESALEILTTLLDIIVVQTRVGKGSGLACLVKDLCQMGLPAAGILTSQLQLQLQFQLQYEPPAPASLEPPLPTNFRSIAIQKLSIFVSHLGSLVDPKDRLFDIAQQGATFIAEALNQTLSLSLPLPAPAPDSAPVAPAETNEAWLGDSNSNVMDDHDHDHGLDVGFLDWCDDIQWPQDSLSLFGFD